MCVCVRAPVCAPVCIYVCVCVCSANVCMYAVCMHASVCDMERLWMNTCTHSERYQ